MTEEKEEQHEEDEADISGEILLRKDPEIKESEKKESEDKE